MHCGFSTKKNIKSKHNFESGHFQTDIVQGRIQGGGRTRRAPPPKIGKKYDFLA
jgi:hypothetical protein